jgi:hypothetical protein
VSRPVSIGIDTVTMGVAAAIAGAAISYFGLAALARPANTSSQIALITRQANEAEQIRSRLNPEPSYTRGAVCEGGGDAGLVMIRQEVSVLAAQNGGMAVEISGTPGAPDEANGGLQPVSFSLEGNGASGSVIAFLQSLSATTPSVFVDKLDLRLVDGKLTLKLRGRLFCLPTHL